jgi:hypothetical protein
MDLKKGVPVISQLDSGGNLRSAYRLLENSDPLMMFFDDKENIIWNAPPDKK